MKQPDTKYAQNGDVSIAYQVIGDGPIDLVVAPGYISHVDLLWTWPELVAFVRRLSSFARLIIYDKRGTGLSDPIAGMPTLEERMEDMHAVLDAVGSERAALLGISEGGPMSVLFAATYPERITALVLYGSFARMAPEGDYRPESEEDFKRRMGMIEGVVADWGAGRSVDFFAPNYADELTRRQWGLFERASASPGMVRALLDAMVAIDVRHVLETVRVPTLVVHRKQDGVIVAECGRYLAQRIPDAKYTELPGTDHIAWLGDMDSIADEVERFLTGATHTAEPERALATVLFTDIANSTNTASELGDTRWRGVLEQHDAIARRHIAAFGGREIKNTGDGFLACFDGPARAIRCAGAIQEDVEQLGIGVRAGVHTGECEMRGDDIGGMAVHIGARVMANAEPGEVLVSSAVRDLVLGSGIRFTDRGAHELKGVPGTWQLLAVGENDDRPGGAGARGAPDRLAPNAAESRPGDRTVLRLARSSPAALRFMSTVTGFRTRRRAAEREREAVRGET